MFQNDGQELKLAYLNVNDLTAEFHTEYINLDKNLTNVDILVIADTRLTKDFSDSWLQEKLDNFIVIARYDSGDLTKHMGLLALCSKKSKLCRYDERIVMKCPPPPPKKKVNMFIKLSL